MENIIEIKNLKKKYDDKFELGKIDISIPKGVIVGLIGENGAGKTTSLECIEGFRKYDSGTIIVNGKIGIQLQSSSLPAHIKPMEAVKLFCKMEQIKN